MISRLQSFLTPFLQATKDLTKAKHLDLDLTLCPFLLLPLACLGLSTHDAATPVPPLLITLIHVTFLDGLHKFAELGLVLAADFSNGQSSCGL